MQEGVVNRVLDWLLELRPTRIRIFAAVVLLLIATAQLFGARGLDLGYLYIVPMLLFGLSRGNITVVIAALACAVVRLALSSQGNQPGLLRRLIPLTFAYLLTGIVTSEITRRRMAERNHSLELENRIQLQEALQEHLRGIVETTPLAIITIALDRQILLKNQSLHTLVEDRR